MTQGPGLSTRRDYSRCKAWKAKLWFTTARPDITQQMLEDQLALGVKNVDLLVIKNFVSKVSTFFMDDSGLTIFEI